MEKIIESHSELKSVIQCITSPSSIRGCRWVNFIYTFLLLFSAVKIPAQIMLANALK